MKLQLNRRRRALANWWFRRSLQLVLALVSCFFLTLSLARILNVNAVNWPAFAFWVLQTYNETLLDLGRAILYLLSNFPGWLFDVVAIYLLVGALVRIAIRDIALKSEKSFYDHPLDLWDDDWHKDGITDAKDAGKIESSRFYLLWPKRLASDVWGGYWSLTPLRVVIYFGLVVAIFLFLILL